MESAIKKGFVRTVDAIAADLLETCEDGVLDKETAREAAMDMLTCHGDLAPEEERFYRDLPYEEKARLAAEAIPYDIC